MAGMSLAARRMVQSGVVGRGSNVGKVRCDGGARRGARRRPTEKPRCPLRGSSRLGQLLHVYMSYFLISRHTASFAKHRIGLQAQFPASNIPARFDLHEHRLEVTSQYPALPISLERLCGKSGFTFPASYEYRREQGLALVLVHASGPLC